MTVERVLVAGGKVRTGRRLASHLTAMGLDVVVGTRTPDGRRDRRFHWADPSSAAADVIARLCRPRP